MDNRLVDAVDKKDRKQVLALLASGVSGNAMGSHGWTALMAAATQGDRAMVDLLLSRGSHVNSINMWDDTPLICAVVNNHLEIARTLIEHGASVDKSGSSGLTALMTAVGKGYVKIAEYLIRCGANVNVQERVIGGSVLVQAVRARKYDCIKLLLAHGADESLRTTDGRTALDFAQASKDAKSIKLLGG